MFSSKPKRKRTKQEWDNAWLKNMWRPLMAAQYLLVCLFDFIIAPSMTMYLSHKLGVPLPQWRPLTLQESGFYHIAMGAIIGISAWTRGQEKIALQTAPLTTPQPEPAPTEEPPPQAP